MVRLSWNFRLLIHGLTQQRSDWIKPPDDVETWCKVCDVFAKMEGLRQLYMHLSKPYMTYEPTISGPLLEPLYRIKRPVFFEVRLPWDDLMRYTPSDDSPFRLIWDQTVS